MANNVNFYEYIGQKIETARIVSDSDIPTDEDKQKLTFSTNLSVSTKDNNDWYCLTRESQGDIISHLEVQIFYCEIVNDLLSDIEESRRNGIEYIYIIDIDDHKFYEVFISMYTIDLDDLYGHIENYPRVKIVINNQDGDDASSNTGDEEDTSSNTGDGDDASSNTDNEEDASSNTGDEEDASSNTGDEEDASSNTGDEEDASSNTGNEEDEETSLVNNGWNSYINDDINMIDFKKAYNLTKQATLGPNCGKFPESFNNLGIMEKNIDKKLKNFLIAIDKCMYNDNSFIYFINIGIIFTYEKPIKEMALYYFNKSQKHRDLKYNIADSHLKFITEHGDLPASRNEFCSWLIKECTQSIDNCMKQQLYVTLSDVIEPVDIDMAFIFTRKANWWANYNRLLKIKYNI
jgi:hypothetical protein